MKNKHLPLLLAFILIPAAAQAASLDGPRLGWVFDESRNALRPILGIPGAAILGAPVDLGVSVEQAVVSPRQDFALVTTGKQKDVGIVHFSRVPLQAVKIHGVGAAPDLMAVSATGAAAALYYKDSGRVMLLTGLATTPKVASELYLSGSPSILAVGDDRTLLAVVGKAVYWVSPHGEVPILTGLHSIGALYLETGHMALVADSVANRIYQVKNVTGVAATAILAGPDQGIAGPVGVAISADLQRAFVANGKTGTVVILDLADKKESGKISCGCKPTGLYALDGENLFRLTEASDRPLWLFEMSAGKQRVLFVPGEMTESGKR